MEGIQGRKCAPLEDMIHRTMNHVQAWTELGRGIRQRHEVIVLDVETSVIFPRIFMYLHISIVMHYMTWSM